MKQKNRFDGLDVAAMTAQMQSLLGHKLANVYDGMALATSISSDSSGKSTFLFKLANPSSGNKESEKDGGADSNRNMLLIESGVRFHTTTFYTTSDNNTLPSPFAMKLRKHMRNLRLENVTQLGNLDRVVDFRFGSGERAHHLILELYGVGNIIMTDGRYVILALLRVHEYGGYCC
jgi:predicted ribosome quality control (RQC) complex YloA/Tae2 family protein